MNNESFEELKSDYAELKRKYDLLVSNVTEYLDFSRQNMKRLNLVMERLEKVKE